MSNKLHTNLLCFISRFIWIGTSHFGRMRETEYVKIFKSDALNKISTFLIVVLVFLFYLSFSIIIQYILYKCHLLLAHDFLHSFTTHWYLPILLLIIYIVGIEEIARSIDNLQLENISSFNKQYVSSSRKFRNNIKIWLIIFLIIVNIGSFTYSTPRYIYIDIVDTGVGFILLFIFSLFVYENSGMIKFFSKNVDNQYRHAMFNSRRNVKTKNLYLSSSIRKCFIAIVFVIAIQSIIFISCNIAYLVKTGFTNYVIVHFFYWVIFNLLCEIFVKKIHH